MPVHVSTLATTKLNDMHMLILKLQHNLIIFPLAGSYVETKLRNYLTSNWGTPPQGCYVCNKQWIEAQRHHTDTQYIPK